MNEQMLELYKQAHVPHTAIDPSNNMPYETTCFSAEKFAELIVREMCQVINDDCELQMRQRIITNLGGLNQARELITKHFGVDE